MNRLPPWARLLLAVTLVRAVFAALTPPTPEEAYHWDFAVHLDWSYYDHPGMIAWSIALGRLIFGDIPFAIRFVPLLFAAGTMAVLARLAGKLYGERAALWAVVLVAVQPVTCATAASGYPDSPMLFFWTLSMSLVWKALDSGRGPWWIAAGAALGAGMVSKYTIVFFGASILLYLLTSPRDRRWLATPWPYLAAVLALALFTPVTYWNATHDWASIRFQGKERFSSANEFLVKAFGKFVGLQWAAVVPLTLPLAVVAVARSARSVRPEERYLFWCFAPMMGFFLALSWTMPIHVLWPLPCWLGLTVVMAGMIADGPERISAFYRRAAPWMAGAIAAVLLLANVHAAFQLPKIPQLSPIHGWPPVAARVRELKAELPPGSFVLGLGHKYYVPALLAWHLKEPMNVYGQSVLGRSQLQFDYWTHPDRLAGRDAAVVIERGEKDVLPLLEKSFRTVEPAGELDVPLRSGKPLRVLFYRARAYIPTPVPRGVTSSETPDTPKEKRTPRR